jgi:hypothetical protein
MIEWTFLGGPHLAGDLVGPVVRHGALGRRSTPQISRAKASATATLAAVRPVTTVIRSPRRRCDIRIQREL